MSENVDPSTSSVQDPLLKSQPGKTNKMKRFWRLCKRHKVRTSLVIIAVLFLALALFPFRYPILGLFVKHDVVVVVVDNVTHQPVSEAQVSWQNYQAMTDTQGRAVLSRVKPGKAELIVSKKYYDEDKINLVVGLKSPPEIKREFKANGRQVEVKITNAISHDSLEGVSVDIAGVLAKTNNEGKASLVVSTDKATQPIKITADGYLEFMGDIQTTTADSQSAKTNDFSLVPTGKVYFLSKKSGKIDVVKTNLDGTERQTVVAGTGNEDDGQTLLLASRDWKYLALLARRDGSRPKLYLINTSNDRMTEINGDSTSSIDLSAVGWQGHNFVYTAQKVDNKPWEPGKFFVKSYNAENGSYTVLDESKAQGDSDYNYGNETISNVYLTKDNIIYTKYWSAFGPSASALTMGVYRVNYDGSNKTAVKEVIKSQYGYINMVLSEPDEAYIVFYNNDNREYYSYSGGEIKADSSLTENSFSPSNYPTYLSSPSGKRTFWNESRDGKNILFTGDELGDEPVELATLSGFVSYGWYSDDYLLVTKDGSELYIASAKNKLSSASDLLKISDYHKPQSILRGYGYGYGGQ